jgi:hypothetical protein
MGVDGDSPLPELGPELVLFEVAWLKLGLGLARRLGLAGSRAERNAEWVMAFFASFMRIR